MAALRTSLAAPTMIAGERPDVIFWLHASGNRLAVEHEWTMWPGAGRMSWDVRRSPVCGLLSDISRSNSCHHIQHAGSRLSATYDEGTGLQMVHSVRITERPLASQTGIPMICSVCPITPNRRTSAMIG